MRRILTYYALGLLLTLALCVLAGCSGFTYENQNGPRGPEKVSFGAWHGFGSSDCSAPSGE